ncbi:hypothetical protein HK098_000732 [Nowakowskiella sp. JEL0407]|nr:hypothetical protein HK098_000732 [Nowakowskiella sp. JEL0407]
MAYVGVDVGTGSVRAAIFSEDGLLLSSDVKEITIFETLYDGKVLYHQSAENIWAQATNAVRAAVDGVKDVNKIEGIGFDATCSLVALDREGNPLSLAPDGNKDHTVIMWMDHRSSQEAELMSKTGHRVLETTGGKISPEMSIAKILWVKNNLPHIFTAVEMFMELPDYLTYRATHKPFRSLNSLVCKWSFSSESGTWDPSFLGAVGFETKDCEKWVFGRPVFSGQPIGDLADVVKKSFGMDSDIYVAVGGAIIDAYAGAIGTLGLCPDNQASLKTANRRLALICGTSSCHIVMNQERILVQGVWGPYKDVLLPGFCAAEGGQSATGKLLDHINSMHPYTPTLKSVLKELSIFEYLNNKLKEISSTSNIPLAMLTKDIHIQPDFHGNRSPIADSHLTGMISGLTIDASEASLAVLYLAAMQALAYETKYIVDTMNEAGHQISEIVISGGMSKNTLLVQIFSDVLGMKIFVPKYIDEAVMLGSAMLGATAAQLSKIEKWEISEMNDLMWKNMMKMTTNEKEVVPQTDKEEQTYHGKKMLVLKKMYTDYYSYKQIMRQ